MTLAGRHESGVAAKVPRSLQHYLEGITQSHDACCSGPAESKSAELGPAFGLTVADDHGLAAHALFTSL